MVGVDNMDEKTKYKLLDLYEDKRTRERFFREVEKLDIENIKRLINDEDFKYAIEEVLIRNAKRLPNFIIYDYMNDKISNFDIKASEIVKFIQKCRFDRERVALLLEGFELPDFETNLIYATLYPDEKLSRREKVNRMINDTLEAIKKGKDNDLFDVMLTNGTNIIYIDYVVDAIKEANKIIFKDYKKSISERYYKVYIELLTRYVARYKQDYSENIRVVLGNLDSSADGYYSYPLESIQISDWDMEDSLVGNLEKIETIFHEVRHRYQDGILYEGVCSYEVLMYALDNAISRKQEKNETDYDEKNYVVMSTEVDAAVHEIIDTYQFLKSQNQRLSQQYLKLRIEDFKENIQNKNSIKRFKPNTKSKKIMPDSYIYEIANSLLDEEDLKNYPILRLICNSDGKLKSIDQIINEFKKAEEIYKKHNTKENALYYTLYLKVLRDYIEMYSRKSKGKVTVNKSTKEIVEEFIESKKHK